MERERERERGKRKKEGEKEKGLDGKRETDRLIDRWTNPPRGKFNAINL